MTNTKMTRGATVRWFLAGGLTALALWVATGLLLPPAVADALWTVLRLLAITGLLIAGLARLLASARHGRL